MNFLTINGRTISFDDLKRRNYEAYGLYERNTLNFCSDWLEGNKDFFLIETSGSTGTPKTMRLERAKMALSAHLTCKTLRLKPNINVLVCLNTKYIGGLMMLVRCFENSMSPIVVDPNSNLLAVISDFTFGFSAFVPLQLNKLLDYNNLGLQALYSIENIIIGGAPLDKEIETKLINLPNNIFQTFGMTETLSHIALRKLNESSNTYVALEGVKFSTNELGCLIVDTELVENGPLITNDLIKLKSATEFWWIGRIDNIINSGGIKVSPEAVEAQVGKVFQKMGINRNFFIYGTADQKYGEIITLGMEGNKLPYEIENTIMAEIKLDCLQYSYPKLFTYASTFIYTASGKINRMRSKELFN